MPESIAEARRKSNMKTYNLCLLGFGNVGCALLDLLFEKRDELWE